MLFVIVIIIIIIYYIKMAADTNMQIKCTQKYKDRPKQENNVIAKMTARCAQYMSALFTENCV